MGPLVQIINQVFEIQHKLKELDKADSFERNFNRLAHIFKESGLIMHDPTGENYVESRTDCEASITGDVRKPMKIAKTLKPIIYQSEGSQLQLLQKAVVLVSNS